MSPKQVVQHENPNKLLEVVTQRINTMIYGHTSDSPQHCKFLSTWIHVFFFCVDAFFCWKGSSICSLSASCLTVNVSSIAFDVEWTIDRDYLGGKSGATFDLFLELYCFKQFHPVHKQILNGCLRWMRATNSLGKDTSCNLSKNRS